MTPAGMVVFHPERKIEAHPTKLPKLLQNQLAANKKAWKNFQAFPPSYQRMTIGWIASAKKEETQSARLEQLIEFSTANQRIKFM